ncbi:retrovirus-related pol polyprotein from transposon RE1 [Citrus sinensis]|nr:retrovirus-related pol polyprotein from transposon RE1 [Citrus sinensis]
MPCDNITSDALSSHPMVTQARVGIVKPNPKYANVVTNDVVEPNGFVQANKESRWRQAMGDEFNALQRAGTWVLVPPHPSYNVLPNKWVYRIKRKADGSIANGLVANGFHQQPGLDFGETFSPVVNHNTIRLILAIYVTNSWPIRQLDVQNAFLHGYLQEDVYMRQLIGFVDPQYPTFVCKLRRSLYGLKQAPRAWFQWFSSHLEQLGFHESLADYSLFIYSHDSVLLYLLIYVDDILITGNSSYHISQMIHHMSKLFSMKDLGPVHYFLGIEATQTAMGLHLCQTKYILDLLHRTEFLHSKPMTTPAVSGRRLSLFDGDLLSNPTEYRSVVGALQYLTITRPDISFAVNQVCQYMHHPTIAHWCAVKRILRYLKGTTTHGLLYSSGSMELQAFSDADYAGYPDDRVSTGGSCIFIGLNLISWSSKKQKGVSRSSTEAEYRQLAYTAATLSWF